MKWISLYLLFPVLFIQWTLGRDLIVSLVSQSADVPACGTDNLPCTSIEYAVDKAAAGDTILIDGGSDQQAVYSLKRTVQMDKELTLRKYRDNSRIPVISVAHPVTLSGTLFNISKSFAMNSLSADLSVLARPEIQSVFLLSGSGSGQVTNCTFTYVWYNQWSSDWNVTFSKCTFKDIPFNPAFKHRFMKTFQQSNAFVQIEDSVITNSNFHIRMFFGLYQNGVLLNIERTILQNSLISFQLSIGSEITMIDCIFNNASLTDSLDEFVQPDKQYIDEKIHILLNNATFHGNLSSGAFVELDYSNISIDSCTFSPADTIISSGGSFVRISNTNFNGLNAEHKSALFFYAFEGDHSVMFQDLNFKNIDFVFVTYGIPAIFSFENVTFQFTTFNRLEELVFHATNSDFRSSAVNIVGIKSELILNNVHFDDLAENQTNTQPYIVALDLNRIKITDCTFEGSDTGVLHTEGTSKILISNTTIKNVTMERNIDKRFVSNSNVVFFQPTNKIESLILFDTTSCTIESDNTTDNFVLLKGSKGFVSCPSTYKMETRNMECLNYSFIFCTKCDDKMYSLKKGTLTWNVNDTQNNNIQCLPCPYEAICEDGIKSKGNYWGYRLPNNTVQFLPCPQSYCCLLPSECLSYDTCAPHRQGDLCGNCQPGYCLSLFGNNRCVLTSKSYNPYLWFLLIAFVFIFLVTHGYMKDMLLYLERCLDDTTTDQPQNVHPRHCVSQNMEQHQQQQHQNDLDSMDSIDEDLLENEKSSCQLLPLEGTNSEGPDEPSTMSGVIKILFFFYQAAFMMRIKKTIKTRYSAQAVTDVLSSFFNIRIDISTSNLDECPLKTDNAVALEIIKNSILFSMATFLLITVVVSEIVTKVQKFRTRRSNENGRDEHFYNHITKHTPVYMNIPYLVRMKCTYAQVLLIGYSTIAMFAFTVVTCVSIQDKYHLYLQGSIRCYDNWWQYVVFVFIVVWVVPFFIALYTGCQMLQKCRITPTQFLFALTFPPVSIWCVVRCQLTRINNGRLQRSEAISAKHLLLVINEPFRLQQSDDNNEENATVIQWESILIFRRLILAACSVFILSLPGKVFAIGIIMLGSAIHQLVVKPYKARHLNSIEMVSLLLLCFLAIINMFWALVTDVDIERNHLVRRIGEIAIYTELLIMLCPFIGVLLHMVLLHCKKVYKRYLLKQD